MLVRDRNIKTATQTWEVETISLADTKQVYRAAMDSVDELASRFVSAWRSANREGGKAAPGKAALGKAALGKAALGY
jgi:hypothetical protein